MKRPIEDWTVMKYGWLAVFSLHVVFLIGGIHWLKSALNLWDSELLSPGQIRIENFITAVYMLTIAFSIILLILAVFVFEIFRTQRKIFRILAEKEGNGACGMGNGGSRDPGPGSGG